MKKFIIKSSLFVIPFIISHFVNIKFSQREQGDLARLGYLYSNPLPYKEVITNFIDTTGEATYLSTLDLNKVHNIDILTIGDSFSDQREIGYQKPMLNKGFSVVNVDRFISESDDNPIQKLVNLVNSDFFSYVKPKYVILENVERLIINRSETLSFSQKEDIKSIKNQIEKYRQKNNKPANIQGVEFFSDATVKTPILNLQYLFLPKPYGGSVYRYVSKTEELFSNNPNNLLFYEDDIVFLPKKNNNHKIVELNNNLNRIYELLSKKGIKFIVLIAPDKYDLYYPYIKNPTKDAPVFFKHLDKMEKNYLYVPSFTILSEEIKKNKDVYFYDDTHWTPNGSFPVAKYILQMIEKDGSR